MKNFKKTLETTTFGKYGKVTQAERLQYYRERIEALTPPKTDYDLSKIEIFEELVKYVEHTAESE